MGFFDKLLGRDRRRIDCGYCYGIFYQILYKTSNLEALKAGQEHAYREIPRIAKEWPYFVDRPDARRMEIEDWLNENCNDEFQFPGPTFKGEEYKAYIIGAFFKEETDAMAFKLRWL